MGDSETRVKMTCQCRIPGHKERSGGGYLRPGGFPKGPFGKLPICRQEGTLPMATARGSTERGPTTVQILRASLCGAAGSAFMLGVTCYPRGQDVPISLINA